MYRSLFKFYRESKLNRKKIITAILVLLVCILPIVCILMIHHLSLCNTLQKIENGNFGESSSLIKLSNNKIENKQRLYDALEEQGVSCGIYLDDTNNINKKIRYLAYTKKYVDLPMLSGRFLEKTDFMPEKYVAVVGKKIKGIYEKLGKKYITIGEQEYQVVGIMGYEEDTSFDQYVFANLFACKQEELNIYSLDFFSKKIDKQQLEICRKGLSKADCDLEVMTENESFSETLAVDFSMMGYFAGLLSCYVLCIVLISAQWLEAQRREMCIRRLIGASKARVIGAALLHYIGILALSFLVGSVYCTIAFPSYKTSFYYGFFISFSILFLFMVVSMFIIKNDSVEEAIKK